MQYQTGTRIHRAGVEYVVQIVEDEHLRVTDPNGKLRQFKIARLDRELTRGTTKMSA